MHMIVAVHGTKRDHKNFTRWMCAKQYPGGGRWNVKVRELKLYDLIMSSDIEEQVTKDLVFYEYSFLPKKMVKWICKIIDRFKGSRAFTFLDWSNHKKKTMGEMNPPRAPDDFMVYITPIGKLEDGYMEDGVTELL